MSITFAAITAASGGARQQRAVHDHRHDIAAPIDAWPRSR